MRRRVVYGGGLFALLLALAFTLGPGGMWPKESPEATGGTTGGAEDDADAEPATEPPPAGGEDPDKEPPAAELAPLPPPPEPEPVEPERAEPQPRDEGRADVGADEPAEAQSRTPDTLAVPRANVGPGTDAPDGSPARISSSARGRGSEQQAPERQAAEQDAAEQDATKQQSTAGIDAAHRIADDVHAALAAGEFGRAQLGMGELRRIGDEALREEIGRSLRLHLQAVVQRHLDAFVADVRDGYAVAAGARLTHFRREACTTLHDGLRELARERGWPSPLAAGVAGVDVPAPPPLPRIEVRWALQGRTGRGRVRAPAAEGEEVSLATADGLFPFVPRLACQPIERGEGGRLAVDQAMAAARAEDVVATLVWLAIAVEDGAVGVHDDYDTVLGALQPESVRAAEDGRR